MTPPETTKQKMRRVVEQAICGLFGHGRLTLSDKSGVYVDICPRCDLNYRALARIEAGTGETTQLARSEGREPDKLQRTNP